MPQERLTMRKIREILRLKWECGLSNRTIARSCSVSHSTVSQYVKRAEAAGLAWPLPDELDEDKLNELMFPRTIQAEQQSIPYPDLKWVHQELRKKNVTLKLLWEEYLEQNPTGYSYSQFCDKYRRWSGRINPTMRLPHKAGEKMYVDYAGHKVPVIDPGTGEVQEAEIFVAVLGASNYTYAEAQWHQDLPNWTGGHRRAYEFFHGVPEVTVPDNLRSGVTSPCRYEPGITLTYQEMAEHYGTAVVPARVRRPRDKAKVEVGVLTVERWILARLRNHQFFNLSLLNQVIRELLENLNNREMKHLEKSRKEMYEELDRPVLKPLPQRPYEFAEWKKARVSIDYHVVFEKHYYSVPHTLLRQEVLIRATERTIEIFYKNRQVALHSRSKARGRHTTLTEHMPPAHQKYSEWSPERFIRWGQKIGPDTARIIEVVLSSRKHPEQAYRACMGILGFTNKFGNERLEAACAYALTNEIHSYRGIKNVLNTKIDQLDPQEEMVQPTLADHANIRGKDYYH